MVTVNSKFTVGRKFHVTLAGITILWIGFQVWVLNKWFGISYDLSVKDSLTSNFILIAASFFGAFIGQYIPRASKLQVVVVLSLILSLCTHYAVQSGLVMWGENNAAYFDFLAMSVPVRAAIYFVVVTATGISMFFYTHSKELQESASHEAATAVMVREAELQKLQLQLQPHFLFNSLNSINALILIDPAKARGMVQQLSDFLRATLKRADEQWITLDQEFVYLHLYLSIERVRFGHRLEVQTECDEQIKLWLIPPLLIQPLVENAIKFGLYGTTENVVINMKTERVNDSLQIEITNPFDADMQPAEGSGFGLNGLRRRLYLLYARNDLLKTTIENNRFTVQLILPEKV